MRRSRGAVVLVAFALVGAGCGGGENADRRHAVDAYFRQVNEVAHRHAAGFRAANAAFRNFSRQSRPENESRGLEKAARTIRAASPETAALEPPPDAVRIHANILAVYRREAALA